MANKDEISTLLKRNLKEGKEYDKLIPRVKCERTTLGKGDTFNTVDWMKDWIEKYSHQTVKISAIFTGRSLEETVNNIYKFLYDHVQYTADGELQQLRSPACTWAQRKEGVDCKSYSVFASSILSNLGIKHAIRQVRQPYFFPEEFTHVYVVVLKDQNAKEFKKNAPTFVLDATKHENVESNFIENVDLPMTKLRHIGLNAPQDERTRRIVHNFTRFSHHLREVGVPANIVNGITAEVNRYTSKGLDPRFRRVEGGISIENKYFPLNFTVDGQYAAGLGFVVSGATAATAAATAMDLLPPDFLNNTFGSIFANGFDLSCWNASYSESKATAALEIDIPFLLKQYSGLESKPSTQSLNKFLNGIAGYIADSVNGQRSKFAKCTRKGYALRQKGAEGARDQVLSSLKRSYNLIPTGKQNGGFQTKMPSHNKPTYQWGSEYGTSPYEYESYRLEAKSNTNGSTTGNNYSQDNGNGNTQNISQEGSKSNTGLIIGGVALAALPLLFFMKKSPATVTKKSSK